MKKQQKSQRIIATFFLLIFFPTLIPTNMFASNNGPKSPEAASFEPIDATDMVNLLTGQYNYVLPLLNVPSPEGGYPIALGYHAGIGLDQESSWTGLGWNVNPGAIDRGLNGYPDDYNTSKINEFFYDEDQTETINTLSLNYSSYGLTSASIGFNWGSNQSLGGVVSVGFGFKIDDTFKVGSNVSVGFGSASGYASIGVYGSFGQITSGINYASGGNISSSIRVGNLGYTSDGTLSLRLMGYGSIGTGISLSSSGNVTVSTSGIGANNSFSNTVSMGDYTSEASSSSFSVVAPTPIGIFSVSFGSQSLKYWLSKNVNNFVTGPLYFHKGSMNVLSAYVSDTGWHTQIAGYTFMDIYEVPTTLNNTLETKVDVSENNLTFPSYDTFNVQAQGLSGSMKCTLFKNSLLFGLDGKVNSDGYKLGYSTYSAFADRRFDMAPNFYFENEISSYLGTTDVNPGQFSTDLTATFPLLYINNATNEPSKPRRKTANFIEYFTNREIFKMEDTNQYGIPDWDFINIQIGEENTPKNRGYLEPAGFNFDRKFLPIDGIGAFNITAVDGKTYHYSLPVYNFETITRTSGIIDGKPERDSYFEKRQLEPYATHWLLTSVTGPDFVDNGDGKAGDGDLGYWVNFEYGNWSDAFIWKAPFKKEFIIDDKNTNVKTWIRGRKQLYYLDKIKTRTHTALFVKSERTDSPSENWVYKSVKQQLNWADIQNGEDFDNGTRFTVPSQNQLKLEKIIILKNSDDIVNKNMGNHSTVTIDYNKDVPYNAPNNYGLDESSYGKKQTVNFNSRDLVLDNLDNWQGCVSKALKVIDFSYDYSLVPGDNRLTLRSVNFKGKSGSSVLPPYKFDYINNSEVFNIDKMDGWGYWVDKSNVYSLNKITTPQGSVINIQYENNKCKSITPTALEFTNTNSMYYTSTLPTYTNETDLLNKKVIVKIGSNSIYPLTLNQSVNIDYSREFIKGGSGNSSTRKKLSYQGVGYISQILPGNGNYEITFNGNVVESILQQYPFYKNKEISNKIKVNINVDSNSIFFAGPRVAKVNVTDGVKTYVNEYKYGENEDGIGYVSYVPFSQNLTKEAPFSHELPAPRVFYEYVTTSSYQQGHNPEGRIRYKFNIMKQKTPNQIKYGDFFEITKDISNHTNNSINKEVSIGYFTVYDNLSAIGQLLEVTSFNSKEHELSKLSNQYYNRYDVLPNSMGVTQEAFQTYKTVDYVDNTNILDKWVINSSKRISYPSIIKSSSESKNGYTYKTEFKDYDIISGISKEQVMTSSDGIKLKTKIIPAYLKYPAMGWKGEIENIWENLFTLNYNKNMLSQTAAEYTYIMSNGEWKETGVGITTWSNNWTYMDIEGDSSTPTGYKEKIWRKHKNYIWNGTKDANGIFQNYDNTNDDSFVWGVGLPQTNLKWKQISEIRLYDHYSNALEVKDVNGNLASTKMGDNDTKVMATGNAGYNEMFYAGGENLLHSFWLEPEVRIQDGASRNDQKSHTGKYSIATNSSGKFGVVMRDHQHSPGKYKLTVWVYKSDFSKARVNVDGTNVPFNGEVNYAGNWALLTHYFYCTVAGKFVYVTSSSDEILYDDLMIRPIASSMTGYVYNENDELSFIIGNNGLATKYLYDSAGRLEETYVEVIDFSDNTPGGFKLKSKNKIKYKSLQ